jgi:hypothetical protein
MALLQPGPIGKVSGVLGGLEVAQVGGHSVIKRCKGRQSSTSTARMNAHLLMAKHIEYWKALLPQERKAWDVSAKMRYRVNRFGVKTALTGLEFFMSMEFDDRYASGMYLTRWVCEATTQITGTPQITIVPGGDTKLSCGGFPSTLGQWAWLYISRFRPQTSDRKAFTWRKIPPVEILNSEYVFTTVLAAEGVEFVNGERVAVKFGGFDQYEYPVYGDLGIVTVAVP